MNVEFTKEEFQLVWECINGTSFPGKLAELVVAVKGKLQQAARQEKI